MSQGRSRSADPRRQMPRDHMPAQLREGHLSQEVDRRRDRDFPDRGYDRENRRSRSPDSMEKNYGSRRSDTPNEERFVPGGDSGKKNYIKPSNRTASNDSMDDRRRQDRGYDDRRYDDRPRNDRHYYDDRPRRDDRYDDRPRNDGYYDDRDRRPPYDDRPRHDDYDSRYDDRRDRDRDRRDDRDRGDDRHYRRDDHVEADRFIETRERPRSQEPRVQTVKPKRYMPPYHNRIAMVCSVVVIIGAFLFIGLGVVTAVLRYYAEAAIPWVAALACMLQAGFGCHSARRQSYNFMHIVTSVAIICAVILWGVFGFFAYYAGRFLSGGYQYQHQRPDLGYVAVAGVVLTFVCLISSMAQIWIACGVTCCAEAPRPKEKEAYHSKHEQSEV